MSYPELTDGTTLVPQATLGNGLGTPFTNSSGNQANTNAVATIAAGATQTAFITGFECTASGATAGLPVIVTVVGTKGGTLSYIFVFPAGVLVGATPLVVEFPAPIPASGLGVNIVVTLPAGGSGNTNAASVAHGFLV